MQKNNAIFCVVLRRSGDCTNHGVSEHNDNLYLLSGDKEDFDVDLDDPKERALCVRLERRKVCGGEYLYATPLDRPEGKLGPMAGGNYLWSYGPNFPAEYPIPIHDRFEAQEEYRLLSY